jgi:5'-3' exonuclease
MGVPGFFAWLLRNKKKLSSKKLIIDTIDSKIKYLMLDTNCLLHPCVAHVLEKYKKNEITLNSKKSIRDQLEELIWERIKFSIDDMLTRLKPEYLYIAIDGVAPMGKILQQRQRRYKYLFDKKIKLTSEINSEKVPDNLEELDEIPEIELIDKDDIRITSKPVSSIELTPGTDYMERIHNKIKEYLKELSKLEIKCIYSSYHEPGEGEHKILQYIKKNISPTDTVVIYGLDADLLFLALSTGETYNLYVMREQQIFNNTELDFDDYIDYNYVEILELHKMISKLDINTNDFIIICYLIGNDFLPGLLTTDIKKSGLDKILTAYETVKKMYKNQELNTIVTIKMEDNKKRIKINYEFLREIFVNLTWTEKWIWKNINRDIIRNTDCDEEELEKLKYKKEEDKAKKINEFALGTNINIECLDRIEFSSSLEYYNYYLGLDELSVNKTIIKKMVKDYMTGIEWCINYYLDDCVSWKWGYNFPIAPLISDIIAYYPKKIQILYSKCDLKPIEQLILAIPPDTYKYVISKDIIDILKKEKRIGYMFPESFDVDINKESLYWKCQVKIPMVEYEEYISVIKMVNISDIKNKLETSIKNFV